MVIPIDFLSVSMPGLSLGLSFMGNLGGGFGWYDPCRS